ncbi:TPA: tRNA isopentenyl-2-thiomethyl-A-37 hydroxylase MiaE [Salmonella enterica]|uniref:tRNA isopentenyl-2-thiomethyl-A-37 hydroxylase MiaE n=7 Tax=Salmonella enterica TaxID=28901 RepID=A0A3R0QRC8_SALET|nr:MULTISPECIES: tRNA isopentenyl-2-thiomethyl-A-37 hydroxylase MiaE [Salmonella]EAA4419110.1 tRNA isopentenyl-2-thiomethyl-A-37 hydroxylase MiaE [Salmonella enterica subsp. enterica serovar Oranienburg]EAA7425836.1 tRNA isopentenyl-2-thiomethyl-A-37 hydroxylase MiaE [Salmonella enterica subsp. enterica serovar Newport]EAY3106650.1 tRNA isopentenyl-2-thiomethyl-A-37 hydroxylase MiaE [Salmonella enterica subsp. enterica serovar Typhimurium]EBN7508489.1 tRNA isopentenyl-2-thiomethyl-A-37 hydroxyl
MTVRQRLLSYFFNRLRMNYPQILSPVLNFLHCPTPQAWIVQARDPQNLPLLLTDHLICELKAAQTALLLVRKYVADKSGADALLAWLQPYEAFAFRQGPEPDFVALHKQISKSAMPQTDDPWGRQLIDRMVLLIKEELHHFWQVREVMQARNIPYVKITASRYAKGMLKAVRTHEPLTLIDKLICGAYIEARSCERFAALAPWLDEDLQTFYLSLLRSEARHYQDYLALAQQISTEDISARVRYFGDVEADLILSPDREFRFHSGVPAVG